MTPPILRRVREQIIDVEAELVRAEHKTLSAEALSEAVSVRKQDLEGALRHLSFQQEQAARSVREEQRGLQAVRQRLACFQDLQELLEGSFSSTTAKFFLQSSADFAAARGMGSLLLEGLLQQSHDGFHIDLEGKSFVFVSSAPGQWYLHPEPVDLPSFTV